MPTSGGLYPPRVKKTRLSSVTVFPAAMVVNDYLAGLGVLLTSGKPVVKVLMLHPMKSAWIAYDGTNTEELKKLDQDFIKASELLSGLHIDYHYGDETIIRKYGKNVGEDGELLYNLMQKWSVPIIGIFEKGKHIKQIHYQERNIGDAQIFFMVNHSQSDIYNAEIVIKGKGRVKLLDLSGSKEIKDLPCSCMENTTKTDLVFHPMQSHVIIWEKCDEKDATTCCEELKASGVKCAVV